MLVSLGLLAYEANQYALVPESSWYLVPGKPTYMGNFLLHLMGWEGDRQLAAVIRHGKHSMTKDLMDEDLDPIWPEFFAYQRAAPEQDLEEFEAMWKSLGIQARDGLKVLDFACGSAIKTLALCRLNPGVTATLQDRPHVLEIAFEIATKLGVADQIEKLPGDMRSVDFGESQFDVIRVGNTLRYLGPAEIGAVLGRVRRAMNPGGVFIIEDFIAEDVVTQGAYAPLDALWLYAITPNGDTYTFSNWQTFLEKAGFITVTRNESLIRAIVA